MTDRRQEIVNIVDGKRLSPFPLYRYLGVNLGYSSKKIFRIKKKLTGLEKWLVFIVHRQNISNLSLNNSKQRRIVYVHA